jgi:hypothetical protein
VKAIEILLEHATSGMLTFDNYRKHLQAIQELEELRVKVKVQDGLLKQYVKKEFDGVVAEIGEVCTDCDNYLKDITIFYDGKKVMICNFCKFNNVSYFKEKKEK